MKKSKYDLESVFSKQLDFFSKIVLKDPKKFTKREKEIYLKEYLFATIVECVEALQEINWKFWKQIESNKYSKESMRKLEYEIVDIFIFFIDLCLVLNITPKKLIKLFYNKYKVNARRYT